MTKVYLLNQKRFLLRPKYAIPPELADRKIFFLAGPIRGGGNWQMRAAEIIWKKYPGSIVADPTRWDKVAEKANSVEKDAILKHLMYSIGKLDESTFPRQAIWEKVHMLKSAGKGKLLFWFEKESENDPRPKDEGVYAQDTRVEAGMWIEKLKQNNKLQVKFGGNWEIDSDGRETDNSFGGLNFIFYYLTGEPDLKKLQTGQVKHANLVIAKKLETFLEKAL